MSKMNKKCGKPQVFACNKKRRQEVAEWLGDKLNAARSGAVVIIISENEDPSSFEEIPDEASRVLLVFESKPVEMAVVNLWRQRAMEMKAWEVHVAFLPFYNGTDEERYQEILKQCLGWDTPPTIGETTKITKGDYVKMIPDSSDQNLATLLTMTLGTTMGDLLTKVEVLARNFNQSKVKPPATAVKEYLKDIGKRLEAKNPEESELNLGSLEPLPDRLPKLLLRGDSGVGKSLIAGYLHSKAGGEGRPLRISIPEFLAKEDMFEYELFGYCKGAYTDGKDNGSPGLLLSHVGQVVFLDEIGEANDYLQAKLLAFLDDYRVRPRAWEGKPFYCPVLIVAATNKDLNEMVKEKKFRGDLLARFTERRVIPGLNERLGDLPFILDCLLQRAPMNPDLKIESIGEGAYEALKNRDYSAGNFRQMENLFRSACELALRDDRTQLVRQDIEAAVATDMEF
jgi:hypothetical protein